MHKKTIKYLVSASSLILAICGLSMVFGPEEFAIRFFDRPSGTLPIALWGSAMIGFAAMNWIARHSILGGIYGRAVVVGNQTHFFIGAMILLKSVLGAGFVLPMVILFSVYALNALLFSYLMFWASGLE